MKTTTAIAAFLLFSLPVFGQTTDTDCNVHDQHVNCTSTTQAPPIGSGVLEGINEGLAKNRAKAEANRAAIQAEQNQHAQAAESKQEQENRALVNVVYCHQNPTGSVSDGPVRTCADELAYVRAFCLVNPDSHRCKIPASESEVEKSFADLMKKYPYDPKTKKSDAQYIDSQFQVERKWACMAYPDMKLPLRDGTYQPCSTK